MKSAPRARFILQTPSSLTLTRSPASVLVSVCVGVKKDAGSWELTVEEEACKSDADVTIPLGHSSPLDIIRYADCRKLLDAPEDALSVAETDDNLGHAEEEGLDPEFHEFAIKHELVVLAAYLNARLKLHPVNGGSWRRRFCVPDCAQKSVYWLLERDWKRHSLASTSPPRQTVVLPNPVRTTEQYCSLLLTISSFRFSMYSLGVSPHGRGSVLRVSNLYPERC